MLQRTLLYCCMRSLSRAQALDTQLEQRGLGAGSAAEALHVLERVASLENELTRCEQQVTASQGIMRRKHLQQQRIIHAAHTHAERHPENRGARCNLGKVPYSDCTDASQYGCHRHPFRLQLSSTQAALARLEGQVLPMRPALSRRKAEPVQKCLPLVGC